MAAYISLQDQAYAYLKEAVLSGTFEEGKFYSETRIASQLGISRTPMRDALQKLMHEGYIDITPSKGFTLHKITLEDVHSTFQIRCAIEGYSAMELAGSLNKPGGRRCLKKLQSLLDAQKQLAQQPQVVEKMEEHARSAYEQSYDRIGMEKFCLLADRRELIVYEK